MKIYDISQEVFGCCVFPGDPAPKREILLSVKNGDVCNLTALSMCAHNGTHIDAPYHFIDSGKTVERISPDKFIGKCCVAEHNGIVTASDAEMIMKKADGIKRILIKGKATVSAEAARKFTEYGIDLIGNESQTVGPEDSPMEVHKILLGNETVLLEGIRLEAVKEGIYFLNAVPISLGGADGAPCRAVLIDFEGGEAL